MYFEFQSYMYLPVLAYLTPALMFSQSGKTLEFFLHLTRPAVLMKLKVQEPFPR